MVGLAPAAGLCLAPRLPLLALALPVANLSLVEKMEMTLEGTLRRSQRKRGEFVDICIYGILHEEWEKR